jgi:hypothetical protein
MGRPERTRETYGKFVRGKGKAREESEHLVLRRYGLETPGRDHDAYLVRSCGDEARRGALLSKDRRHAALRCRGKVLPVAGHRVL